MPSLVDLIGVLATVTVIAMVLGPAPSVLEMLRTKSTGVTPFVPLVALGVNGWTWTMYGYLGGSLFPVAFSNCTGAVLAVGYTAVFYKYSRERAYAHKVLAVFGLLFAASTSFAVAGSYGLTGQTRAEVQSVLGCVGMLTVLVFFASPFENIALVFRHRNAVYIPIQLVGLGALNSAMWSLYSLLTADWFIFVPNFGALLIGLAQIVLYVVFHPSKQTMAMAAAQHAYPQAEYSPKSLEAGALLHGSEAHAVAPLQTQAAAATYGAANA